MRARWKLVSTCCSHLTPRIPFINKISKLVTWINWVLYKIWDNDTTTGILNNHELLLGVTSQQISHLLVIDLEIADAHAEHGILCFLSDGPKQPIHALEEEPLISSRSHTLTYKWWVLLRPQHGMGLACPSHSIGEAGHVEPIHYVWDQGLHTGQIDLLIRYRFGKNYLELKRFVTEPILDRINRLGSIINNINLCIISEGAWTYRIILYLDYR